MKRLAPALQHGKADGQVTSTRRSKIAGFTLVELAVVIALVGVVSAIAYQRISPALEHARVNSAAAVLAADLQYSQMLAVRQRKPVVVIANSALKQYLIRDAQTSTVFRTRFMGADTDLNIDELTVTPTSAEIFPNGTARQMTTYTLGLNGYRRKVRLTRAGQVRVISVP